MRLQSKKIAGVFLLSLLYWLYLSLTTRMGIISDSVSYESLGRMICTQGWVSYFTTGPNREPLYPLLIALSMHIGHLTGLAYVKIMAFFGVMLLFLTQLLTYKILRLLNIRTGICMLVLAYLALSPALNNAAFSLYSEIAVLPVILGIILASASAWNAVSQNKREWALMYGALLGLLLTAATLIKAIFECISPAYLVIFFAVVIAGEAKQSFNTNKIATSPSAPRNDILIALLLCLAAAVSFFYVPITDYKWFNRQYNGNFAITNRASWALYGNTVRRMEPLTVKRFAEALAYAPGEGVCNSFFGANECDFWSFKKSDELGFAKKNESSAVLLKASIKKALHDPFQYISLTFIEGLKMFFWESTQVGFVSYPHWLQNIYDTKIFNNGLRFFVSLMTLIAVMALWLRSPAPPGSPVRFLIGLLIFLYTLFFSFFFILTRYALPIAPLYLITIGAWINNLASKKIN